MCTKCAFLGPSTGVGCRKGTWGGRGGGWSFEHRGRHELYPHTQRKRNAAHSLEQLTTFSDFLKLDFQKVDFKYTWRHRCRDLSTRYNQNAGLEAEEQSACHKSVSVFLIAVLFTAVALRALAGTEKLKNWRDASLTFRYSESWIFEIKILGSVVPFLKRFPVYRLLKTHIPAQHSWGEQSEITTWELTQEWNESSAALNIFISTLHSTSSTDSFFVTFRLVFVNLYLL